MEQTELLQFVIEVLEQLEIPYAIVGSFASGVWGESRFTQDIDIVVQVDRESVIQLCRAFPGDDFYVSENAATEAVVYASQFNVIHPTSGNKIDFMVASESAWNRAQIARRTRLQLLPNCEGYVAAPEDVILGKLLYFRNGGSDKHLRDIAGILKISHEVIDFIYLQSQAAALGVSDLWESVRSSGT